MVWYDDPQYIRGIGWIEEEFDEDGRSVGVHRIGRPSSHLRAGECFWGACTHKACVLYRRKVHVLGPDACPCPAAMGYEAPWHTHCPECGEMVLGVMRRSSPPKDAIQGVDKR